VLGNHRAQQREHILAVALELLAERGMAALTMSAIADHAGISRATLYHYFPDVDAVLAAWVGQEIERSVSAMLVESGAISDPVARLTHLVKTQARIFGSRSHRLSAEHFESEAGSPAVRREVEVQMAPLRQLLADTITEAENTGLLRSPVDSALAADFVLGLLGAIRRRLVAGTLSPDDGAHAIMELLRAGWFHPAPVHPRIARSTAGRSVRGKSSGPTRADQSPREATSPSAKSDKPGLSARRPVRSAGRSKRS
jgi:AcrR family transcriptional regulator